MKTCKVCKAEEIVFNIFCQTCLETFKDLGTPSNSIVRADLNTGDIRATTAKDKALIPDRELRLMAKHPLNIACFKNDEYAFHVRLFTKEQKTRKKLKKV